MKNLATWSLRGIIYFIGLVVVLLGAFIFPAMVNEIIDYLPKLANLKFAISMDWDIILILFILALFLVHKFLKYLDQKQIFSEMTVELLKNIKLSFIAISVLYLLNMPIIYLIADKEDAPGLIIFGLSIVIIPLTMIVISAIIQKIIEEGISLSKNQKKSK